MTVRIVDGLGADTAAAVLRKAGLEVEIIHPPKVLAFWQLCSTWAGPQVTAEAQAELWSLADPQCRKLWRAVVDGLAARTWFDPDIVALMDAGEVVGHSVEDPKVAANLERIDGRWILRLDGGGWGTKVPVSDRLAAAWLADFDSVSE